MSDTNSSCIVTGAGCTSPTNLPEFIDTASCLCGLVPSKVPLYSGGQEQKWRCIGNASANIGKDSNGKWYNTTLPSQELSGINQPQNWGENPPDTSKAFTLEDVNGMPVYVQLGPQGSPNLMGNDINCTGKNNTGLSGTFYSHGNSPASSSASSKSSPSTSSKLSSSSAAAATSKSTASTSKTATSSDAKSSTPSATSSVASSSAASSVAPSSAASSPVTSAPASATSAGSTPLPSSKSTASRSSLKTFALIGMLVAPMIALAA